MTIKVSPKLETQSSKLKAISFFPVASRRGIFPHENIFERRDATEKNESPQHLHTRIYENFGPRRDATGKKIALSFDWEKKLL